MFGQTPDDGALGLIPYGFLDTTIGGTTYYLPAWVV
jgi:hypothetical protein